MKTYANVVGAKLIEICYGTISIGNCRMVSGSTGANKSLILSTNTAYLMDRYRLIIF